MNVTEPTTHLGDQLKLPAALAPLTVTAQWCVWRGARGEDGRWRPVSFITAVDPAQAASINDPATWCDFLSASSAVRRGKADGIAFVLLAPAVDSSGRSRSGAVIRARDRSTSGRRTF
jgi:primase-polymerase (primpol)-like protein